MRKPARMRCHRSLRPAVAARSAVGRSAALTPGRCQLAFSGSGGVGHAPCRRRTAAAAGSGAARAQVQLQRDAPDAGGAGLTGLAVAKPQDSPSINGDDRERGLSRSHAEQSWQAHGKSCTIQAACRLGRRPAVNVRTLGRSAGSRFSTRVSSAKVDTSVRTPRAALCRRRLRAPR